MKRTYLKPEFHTTEISLKPIMMGSLDLLKDELDDYIPADETDVPLSRSGKGVWDLWDI